MKIIKGGLLGAVCGLLYAFISFYLITPVLRRDSGAILFYGFQGLILGVLYASLKLIAKRIINAEYKSIVIINLMIGMISGFFSSSFTALITYYKTIVNASGFVTDEVKMSIMSRIILFCTGSLLIGLIVGLLVGLWELKGKDTQLAGSQKILTR